MKSFIVATMLVAAVAGQTFDMFKYGQDKSFLMNKMFGQDELMYKKLGYPVVDKSFMYGQKDLTKFPMYFQDDLLDSKVFTIAELYTTELFQEYMTLPLFREYIQYPSFRSYVQSLYFQKFWTVPAFKQYFVDTTLFYKYVLPIVQLFKYDSLPINMEQTQVMNKNAFPSVSGYERDFYMPTVYNKDYLLQDGVYYKNLLANLYSQLYKIDETTTVKKIVDPITGEIKIVSVPEVDTIFADKLVKDILLKKFLINKNVDMETVFGDKLIADLLFKKNVDVELLKKIILAKNIDTTVFGDDFLVNLFQKKNVDVDLVKGLLKKDVDAEFIKKILLNKMITESDVIPQDFYLKEKMMMDKVNPIIARMIKNNYPVYNKFDTVEKMNIFDLLTKKFETVDAVEKMNIFDVLTKKNLVTKDKILLNKILADKINEVEKFGNYQTYQTMPKMVEDVTPFARVPLNIEGVKPMIEVRNFDKKLFPELIKA